MKENNKMKESKIEISSVSIGVLSFVLMFFGFIEGVILILGFSILAQKDKWLTRQVLQALYLRIFYLAGILVVGWFFKGILFILNIVNAYGVMEAVASIQSFIEGLIYIGLLILTIIGVMKLLREQDANIPLVVNFVTMTLGEKRNFTNNTANIVNQSQKVYQNANVDGLQVDGVWRCSCGSENTGNFCVSCGKKRE